MSKFEINRMTIELIRAILRFHSSFLLPMSKENNMQVPELHFFPLLVYEIYIEYPSCLFSTITCIQFFQ